MIANVDEQTSSVTSALAQAAQALLEGVQSNSTLMIYSNDSEAIVGSESSNYIDAGLGDDTVTGGDASDILSGGFGSDKLYGGKGQDSIDGGAGSDCIEQDDEGNTTVDAFYEVLNGGTGNDTIYGGLGSDSIGGGDGIDYLYGEALELASAQREDIEATTCALMMNDTIYGGAGYDIIQTGEGDDLVYGGTSSDTINTGIGNDVAYGESGNDVMLLGAGDDYAEGGEGNNDITLYTGNDTAISGAGDDTISGIGNDQIDAGAGNDTVTLVLSDNSDDSAVITAGEGKDSITLGAEEVFSAPTINLGETRAPQDTVIFNSVDAMNNPVIIEGFDLAIDQLDLNEYLYLYGDSSFQLNQGMKIYSELGEVLQDRVQIVSSTETEWQSANTQASNTDEFGKTYFVIQGDSADSGSVEDVAAFLDDSATMPPMNMRTWCSSSILTSRIWGFTYLTTLMNLIQTSVQKTLQLSRF